jgi:hypothetical protein
MSDYGSTEGRKIDIEAMKSPARVVRGPQDTMVSEEDSLENKISLRMEIMMKKEKLRQQEESNYTYKPKIYTTHKTRGTPNSAEDEHRENRFDKLYGDALKRHISTNLKEDPNDKELTFSPKITRAGSASRSASRERSATPTSVSSDKSGSRSNSVRKSVAAEKPTFQPAITKRAKSIERSRDKEVTDRLYEHGQHVKEKKERKKAESDQKEMEHYTFQPKIEAKQRSASASKMDVLSRMNKFEENRQKKIQEAQHQKKEVDRSFSFQPRLFAKRSSTPTQQPFHERLAVAVDKPISHSAAEAMAQLTFQPQIISKRAPSVSFNFFSKKKKHIGC